MNKILCVGWLCVLGCGGDAFSVAVDAGAIQPLTLSPEAAAADDGQTQPAEAQDAGTVVLEDADAGEDAHPVMTSDAGDVVDADPAFCCYVAAAEFSQPVEQGFTCGGVASRPRCILGETCQDSILSSGIVVLCSEYETDAGDVILVDGAPPSTVRCGTKDCGGCIPVYQVACCKADDTCGCSSTSPATACK